MKLSVPGLPLGVTAAFTNGIDEFISNGTVTTGLTISTTNAVPASIITITLQVARVANCQGSGNTNGTATLDVIGGPAQLAFVQQPTNRLSTQAFSPAPSVQVQDAAGHPLSSNASITLAIDNNPGSGTLNGTPLSQNAVNGLATFPGLSIDKAGTGYTLKATSTGLDPATSQAFNITVGPVNKLAFTTQPSGGVPSTVFTTQPVVTVQDAGGNTITTNPGMNASITLSIAPGTGTAGAVLTCTGSNSRTASNGVATFTGCQINLAGTGYRLRAITTINPGAINLSVDSDLFNIVANNQAPVAHAGADKSGDEGSAILLDGSASSDADGAADLPLTFAWTVVTPLVGFAPGAACSLNDATLEKPSITCTDNGTVKVKLQVTDKRGLVSANQDEVQVTVNNAKPTATFAATPATLNEGAATR